MRKIFLILIALLITTSCLATDTYIRDANNTIISPSQVGTSLYCGVSNNISSSTAVQLSGSTRITQITLQTLRNNTAGHICVGGSSLTAANGFQLVSGAVLTLGVDQMSDVYLISPATDNGSNGVSYIAIYQ